MAAGRHRATRDEQLEHQLAAGVEDPQLTEVWAAFQTYPAGTLGREVWNVYRGRGFGLPGSVGGASAYLAQHDFVRVLADYGTNLKGELEVFSLISRVDPDPKGFAGSPRSSVSSRPATLPMRGSAAATWRNSGSLMQRCMSGWRTPCLGVRVLCDRLGVDVLEIAFHEHAAPPVADVRADLGFIPKSEHALAAGSPGTFDLDGMSRIQQEYAASPDAPN